MSTKLYVYSTLSQSISFNIFAKNPEGESRFEGGRPLIRAPLIAKTIFILGGANIAREFRGSIRTFKGVETEITSDDLAELEKNTTFNHFVNNGYFFVSKKRDNAEKIAEKEMEKEDKASPMNDSKIKDKLEKVQKSLKNKKDNDALSDDVNYPSAQASKSLDFIEE